MLLRRPDLCATTNGLLPGESNRRRFVLVLRVGLLLQLHPRDQDDQADRASTGKQLFIVWPRLSSARLGLKGQ